MSLYANSMQLMGNLTRDPELITLEGRKDAFGNDVKICNFGIATNRRYRNNQTGETDQETCYVDCVAFGRQAEVIHEYCEKGSPLYVSGYLRLDTWERNGVRNQKLKGVAQQISLLGAGDGTYAAQQAAAAGQTAPAAEQAAG